MPLHATRVVVGGCFEMFAVVAAHVDWLRERSDLRPLRRVLRNNDFILAAVLAHTVGRCGPPALEKKIFTSGCSERATAYTTVTVGAGAGASQRLDRRAQLGRVRGALTRTHAMSDRVLP
jgi:hypothetical protein